MAEYDDSLNDFAQLIWGKRAEGLPVPELDLKGEITPQELQHIKQRYAFAQIIHPDSEEEFTEIRVIRSRSGWIILDYGAAMTSSPGEQLFSHGVYRTAEDGSLERVCTGNGTIVMQIIDTAADMVRLAKDRGWDKIQIVDGYALMIWGIWKAGQDLHLPVTGFFPSKEEEARYERIKKHAQILLLQSKTPGFKRS